MSALVMGAIILTTLHAHWGNYGFAAIWAALAFITLGVQALA